MTKHILILSFFLFITPNLFSAIENIHRHPAPITLSGKNGGKLNGNAWNSKDMRGNLTVLFYVDPDQRDLNNDLSETLKAKDYSPQQVSYVAAINMKATWLPNFVIKKLLKKKQERYPNTTYLKDFRKFFVKKWGLKDHSNQVVIFDQNLNLIYSKAGQHQKNDIKNVINLIESHIKKI